MANPLTRIYITDAGDIVVTDLWKHLADQLSPHFTSPASDEPASCCPLPPPPVEPSHE